MNDPKLWRVAEPNLLSSSPGKLQRLCQCGEWVTWRSCTLEGYYDDGVELKEQRRCLHCRSSLELVIVAAPEG